jgi:hypothetical protein
MTEARDDYDEMAELEAEGRVIQHEVQNVAILPNEAGDIVIKEIVHSFPGPCITEIVIGRANAMAAASAILRAAGFDLIRPEIFRMMLKRRDIDWNVVMKDFDQFVEAEANEPDGPHPAPRDRTAAERMRRYRRKRNAKQRGDRNAEDEQHNAAELPLRAAE